MTSDTNGEEAIFGEEAINRRVNIGEEKIKIDAIMYGFCDEFIGRGCETGDREGREGVREE